MAAPCAAQTLPELAAFALAADPGVRASTGALRAAEQRPVQARAAFGPTANVTTSTNFTASTNKTQYREEPDNTLRPLTGDQYTLQVSQPLWRGTLIPAAQAALEYPPLRKDSLLAFDVESHRPDQGEYEALSFNKDGYRFPVDRVLTSEPGQAGKSGLHVCRLAADRIAPPVETTCKSPLMPLSMGLETVLRAPR